ncbi:hypothetical protein HG530_008832 [Fusarium avenaceum]|nr:hypothetical protein HG530_008832 [Fusarium avenaceum]
MLKRLMSSTSRNPPSFSTAARAIASLTNTSKYLPAAALASLDIRVASLAKNSCRSRVRSSGGIVLSSSSSSTTCTSRVEGSARSSSSSESSNGLLDWGSGSGALAALLAVAFGRPRPAPVAGFQKRVTVCYTKRLLEGLAEEEDLELIVDGKDTSTGNTTENVGTSTLEERLDTLLGDDLAGSIHGVLVLDGLTGGHHHATTDGVKRVRGDTGTGGDDPTKGEGGKEVALEVSGEDDRLDRVVHTEVETTVDNNTSDGGHETTVKTGNTVRGEGLLVDVDETVELTVTTGLGVLGIVGKTGTGVVQRVDEQQRSGTSGTTGGQVTNHPHGVAILVLLVTEELLELVTESEVQSLGREVSDDVGGVSSPEGHHTLVSHGALEAVTNTGVLAVETTGLKHLILLCLLVTEFERSPSETNLVLDEELDTLNGSGGSLRDGGGNTTHYQCWVARWPLSGTQWTRMWGFSGTNPALILGLSFELAARLQDEMPVHPDFLSSAETWTRPGKTWELLLYGIEELRVI